jgi:hypothetical protein
MKPMLKPPETQHLKLKYDILLLTFAFKFNMRRYTKPLYDPTSWMGAYAKVGRCRSTVSKPSLKASIVPALETKI